MKSSWICVDASLVVRLVIDPDAKSIHKRWKQWISEGLQLAAPTLLYYEVTNALYRYQKHGMRSSAAVNAALKAAQALPITLYNDADLHNKAMVLAEKLSLPAAYDAHYLALAEKLGYEFWTADRKLVRAVQSELPWVQLLD